MSRGPLLGPEHVGRRSPPAAWEAFFLIGIFPAAASLRWCKVQLFSGGRAPGRHCISSLEGIDGAPNVVTLLGRADRIERRERALGPGDLSVAPDGWDVRAPGAAWSGALPALTLRLDDPAATAATESRDLLSWIRLPRVLTYWSAFGPLAWRDAAGLHEGLGLVEHAWGASSPWDLGRIARAWHWDVLALDDGSFAAGLALEAMGGLRGLHGGARLGGAMERVRGLGVRVEAWDCAGGRATPLRWNGAMRTRGGLLRYEARATTPIAPAVPDGGFLGFAFEGEWRSRGAAARPVYGTGFCEYRARAGA